jgi:hypothetical protein
MIALQSRNPQLPDPAAQTAKFVNMMNMAKQQEAAQRQAALAQQTMDINQQENARAGETQRATMRDKDLDYKIKDMNRLRNIGVVVLQTEDPTAREAAYQSLVEMIGQADQQLGDTVRRVAPTFNAKVLQGLIMEADKYTDKKWATPVASVAVNDRTGETTSITAGGIDPRAEVIGNVVPENTAPAPAAPTAAAAPESNPFAADAPPANTAAENVNSLGLVVASARETGVISQKDVSKLLSVAAPGSAPKLMGWLKQNNIQVVPNTPGVTDNQMRGAPANLPNEMTTTPMAYDGQTPPSQYADLRGPAPQSQTAGLRGAPPMEQTMLQAQGRTPFIARRESPYPGSAQVPIERVRAEGAAGRESAGEVYAKEKARARAQREALLEAGPKPLTAPQEAKLRANITKDYKSARSTIDMMLNPVAGVVAAVNNVRKLSPDQKEAITGYSGYLPTMYASTKSADTAVKNLKGKVTEMGKSVAALTGAIGQMAVQEWRIVSDMIASLDLEGMGAADLDNQLDIIEAQARRAVDVTRDAYENQYVEEFDRYPGRFRLPDASAAAAPAAQRRTPTKGAVDRNNPLLRN